MRMTCTDVVIKSRTTAHQLHARVQPQPTYGKGGQSKIPVVDLGEDLLVTTPPEPHQPSGKAVS